jgi:hypothetical protein
MILSLATACGSVSPKAEPVVLGPGRGVPNSSLAPGALARRPAPPRDCARIRLALAHYLH